MTEKEDAPVKFCVIKNGLYAREPNSDVCEDYWERPLNVGEVIELVGQTTPRGQDKIRRELWKVDGQRAEIHPHEWGETERDYLAEVD